MALAARPQLLILDEPTTGLDSHVQASVLALISELQRELGFASLLISHDLPLVAAALRPHRRARVTADWSRRPTRPVLSLGRRTPTRADSSTRSRRSTAPLVPA